MNNDYGQNSDRRLNRNRPYIDKYNRKYSFSNLQMFCILGILIINLTFISIAVYFTNFKSKKKVLKNKLSELDDCSLCNDISLCPQCLNSNITNNGEKIEICLNNSEKCLECFSLYSCKVCNSGYFFPNNKYNTQSCKKCSLAHCDKCSGELNSDICESCQAGFDTILDEEEKITKCECKTGTEEYECKTCNEDNTDCIECYPGYELENGMCVLKYFIKATFITLSKFEEVKMSYGSLPYCKNLIINGEYKQFYPKYQFKEIGEYTVYYIINQEKLKSNYQGTASFSSFFSSNKNLVSISFTNLVNTINPKSMAYMFSGCNKLTSIDFGPIKGSSIESMNSMFYNCEELTTVNMENFLFTSLKSTEHMFYNCYKLTTIKMDLSTAFYIETMEYMFMKCKSLVSIDLSGVESPKLTRINSLFSECTSLKSVNLSNFSTDTVVFMSYLFKNCSSLTSIDLSSFNTRKALFLYNMFFMCESLTSIDISNFYIDSKMNEDRLWEMFYGCKKLTYINMQNFHCEIKRTNFFTLVPKTGTIIVPTNRVENIHKLLPQWTVNP